MKRQFLLSVIIVTMAASLAAADAVRPAGAQPRSEGDVGATYLALDPASGTDELGVLQAAQYNDFPKLRWLGHTRGTTRLFAVSAI